LIPNLAAAYALKIYGDYVADVYEYFLAEMFTNSGSEEIVTKKYFLNYIKILNVCYLCLEFAWLRNTCNILLHQTYCCLDMSRRNTRV